VKWKPSWDDAVSISYHMKQYSEQKRSTLAFINFISPYIRTSKVIIDIGCGAGAATLLLATNFRKSKFIGIDSERILIQMANKATTGSNLDNLEFRTGNWFKLKKFHMIDGVISLATISWLSEYEKPMKQIFKKINPQWIAMSGLFYEGKISTKTIVFEHVRDRKVHYNTYSISELDQFCKKFGYTVTKYRPFKIDISIKKPKSKDLMSTYTLKTENFSDNLQISGPLLLNWYFIYIKKINTF
jgi:2-polyprenyl-3-methyl-5-hydroxy-6-metoxy-1,4-benzoquinol methylase